MRAVSLALLLAALAGAAAATPATHATHAAAGTERADAVETVLEELDAEEGASSSLLEASAAATLRATAGGTQINSAADMRRAFLTVAPHGMTREAFGQFFVHSMGAAVDHIPAALRFDALDLNRDGLLSADEFTRAFAHAGASVHALPVYGHHGTAAATAAATTTTTTTTSSTSSAAAAGHAAGVYQPHHGTAATAAASTTTTTTTTSSSSSAAANAALHNGVGGVNAYAAASAVVTNTSATVNGVYYPPGSTLPAGYGANGLPLHDSAYAYGANGGYNHDGVYYPPGTNPTLYASNHASGLYSSRPSKVDWYSQTNSKAHRTLPYRDFLGAHKVVLRRGQTFKLDLIGPAGLDFDAVSFTVGMVPVHNVGRNRPFGSKTWGCKVKQVVRNHDGHRRATYSIFIPSVAPIGEFELAAVSQQFDRVPLGTFVILFNAWSKFDDVYLKDPAYRTEYTYADSGRVWFGDALHGGEAGISSAPWNYHQYELLHIILKIVREFVPPHDRHDPARVARTFTWVLNNAGHDRGVLEGRWDGQYSDGVKPTAWSGSRDIFQRWASTGRPVKYGQCWVFANILTTAMRSVGIPCRSVTNFRSAHDSAPFDHMIEVDEGESVWNFHVWNEIWLRRRDIGQGFQWNAIDATPQEQSEGRYQMGPASLYDVRHNRDSQFDTGFVTSEVNAHVWLRKSDYVAGQAARVTDFDAEDVGRFVSTLRPGCVGTGNACRMDLTKQYKANRDPFTRSAFLETGAKAGADFQHLFRTDLLPQRPVAGQPFEVRVRRSHLNLEVASNVQVQLLVESISYTGLPIGVVKRVDRECVLTPQPNDPRNTCSEFMAGHSWRLVVSEADVRATIGHSTSFRASVRVVHIDGQRMGLRQYVWYRQFSLVPSRSHHMAVSGPQRVMVGQAFQLGIHVRNPLHYPMTGVVARVDGPDTDRVGRFGSIRALGRVKLVTKPMVISTPGVHQISVSLDTNEYPDLYAGFTLLAVMPAGGYKADRYMLNNMLNARKYSSHVYDYYDKSAQHYSGVDKNGNPYSTNDKANTYDKSTTGSYAASSPYFQSAYNNMYVGNDYTYKAPTGSTSRVAKSTKALW